MLLRSCLARSILGEGIARESRGRFVDPTLVVKELDIHSTPPSPLVGR
jgi:hypothetical protein